MITSFEAAVCVFRNSTSAKFNGSVITGSIDVSDRVIDCLRVLDNANLIAELVQTGRAVGIDDVKSGAAEKIEFEINNPSGSTGKGYFVDSLDELLSRPEHCLSVPDRIYICSTDLLVPDESDSLIEEYRKAAALASLLDDVSEFSVSEEISFIYPERLDVRIVYSQENLLEANLIDLEKLSEELRPSKPDHHSERRLEIFVHTLFDYLKNIEKADRLGYLIHHLDEVYRSYRRDYELYAKDFSFKKLVAELDEAKAEQMKRLNGVLQDISTKLLAVPLAYVLIAGELIDNGGMKNHIIIIGASIFTILMMMLIAGQLLSLRHIRQDIDLLQKDYQEPLLDCGLGEQFNQLYAKYWTQKIFLCIVFLLVSGVFGLSFWLYSDYTETTVIEHLGSYVSELLQGK